MSTQYYLLISNNEYPIINAQNPIVKIQQLISTNNLSSIIIHNPIQQLITWQYSMVIWQYGNMGIIQEYLTIYQVNDGYEQLLNCLLIWVISRSYPILCFYLFM